MRAFQTILTAIFTLAIISASAQSKSSISGNITNSDGQPAAMVSIQVREIKKGTTSNERGEFSISNVNPGHYTLVISYVGVPTIQTTIDVEAGKPAVTNIQLEAGSGQLQEVVVLYNQGSNNREASIGKTSIKPMDLPQSVAVIGEKLIRDQQAQRLSDVIKNVNGVYLATARASTQENFYARGYSFSSTNMFKNGSRVNSGAMPEVSSLESVEILKGGTAILFGNVAPGGILNMVTKKPKFEHGGEVSMRAGSYDLYKPSIDIYGPINKSIAYRLNGTFESANSYRDQVGSKRYYVNPSFLFKLSNNTELILEGDYLKHDFTPDFGIGTLDNTRISPLSRSTFLGTDWQYSKTRQATASANLRHRFSDNWQLDATGSFQQYSRDYYAVERIQANAAGDWARPLGRTDTREQYVTGQVNLNGKFRTGNIGHTLLVGADAERYLTRAFNYDIQGKIYDTINILDPVKYIQRSDVPVATRLTRVKTPVVRTGAYVQDLIALSDKFKVLAGVRWSLQESRPVNTNYLAKDSVALGKIQTDRAFSPRIGLVYRPTPTTSLFVSYSNSFGINTGTDIYNNALKPSIIDQFEIGVKNILLKGKLTANITAYRIVNNNLAQTAQFDANGLPNNNAALKELTGQTTSDGIEVDLTATPVEGLSLIAGYSYNKMRYTKTPDTKGSYVEGERLVNTPAHTANYSMMYTVPKGHLKGFQVGAALFYVGDRFGGWNNTIGQTQQYSRLIAVEGFTTLDFSAGYSFKKISLLAKVSNLTNTFNYYVHENYSINPIPPTQVVATVSYRF